MNNQRTIREQSVNTNTSVKSVKTTKSDKNSVESNFPEPEIAEVLEHFNSTLGRTFKTLGKPNFKHWRSVYEIAEIKQAIDNISNSWMKDNPTPDLLFRLRNSQGECDYIGQLLNLKVDVQEQPEYEVTLPDGSTTLYSPNDPAILATMPTDREEDWYA